MADQSRLVVSEQDGVTIVGFAQPMLLDAYHIGEVGKELLTLVEKEGHRRLVLDMSSIKMLSSQALGVLLNLRHKLNENDGRVVISGIDPRLYRVFKITRLQDVFEFYEDAATAVGSFEQ